MRIDSDSSQETKIWRVFAVAMVLVGFTLLFCFDPARAGIFPPCPLHYVTGLYCPGCGSLRAIHQLLHGNIARAFALNPLMVASLPLMGLLLVRRSWTYRPWLPWCALAVLLCYGVLRNIGAWPFFLLAPR